MCASMFVDSQSPLLVPKESFLKVLLKKSWTAGKGAMPAAVMMGLCLAY